jgi:hypothetical protein
MIAGLRKRCSCSRRRWSRCRHAWHFDFRFRGAAYGLYLPGPRTAAVAAELSAAFRSATINNTRSRRFSKMPLVLSLSVEGGAR